MIADEVEKDLDYIKRIRATAGNEMEILLDFGGRWNLPSAMRIAKALEPYNIYYLEDIMEPDNVNAYAKLASETSIPICVSETFSTRYRFRDFLEAKAVDIVMFDFPPILPGLLLWLFIATLVFYIPLREIYTREKNR